jgi:hypothetical protein
MSRQQSRTPKLGDTSLTSKGPETTVAKTNHDIRIVIAQLIGEALQFCGKLLSDPRPLRLRPTLLGIDLEHWITGECIRLRPKEMPKVIGGRVDVEDVGAVDFGVMGPDLNDAAIVVGAVVEGD